MKIKCYLFCEPCHTYFFLSIYIFLLSIYLDLFIIYLSMCLGLCMLELNRHLYVIFLNIYLTPYLSIYLSSIHVLMAVYYYCVVCMLELNKLNLHTIYLSIISLTIHIHILLSSKLSIIYLSMC